MDETYKYDVALSFAGEDRKYVEEVAKANGAKIAIKGFVRFETGEGIEKRQDDFAAEVAAQVAGK